MKILQGPADKELSEEFSLYFKTLQRVKPTASRSVSSETYYLCHGYMQSQHESAIQARKLAEQLELNEDNP